MHNYFKYTGRDEKFGKLQINDLEHSKLRLPFTSTYHEFEII